MCRFPMEGKVLTHGAPGSSDGQHQMWMLPALLAVAKDEAAVHSEFLECTPKKKSTSVDVGHMRL